MKSIPLGTITSITTGKLDVNAGTENGLYPFFTCAAKPYKINEFAFDTEAVLVAGNGDLNVKYYKGKFNAYQRTYVIQNVSPKELSMKYLYYFMESYLENLRRSAIGGIIKYIKLGNLTDAQIPLPPLDDQKRIAHLLGKVEGMIARRKQHMKQLDELLKSVFLEMFGDPVRNEKGWEKIKVDDFAEVRIGPFGSLLHSEDYIENGIPLINPSHMIDGEIVPDKTQTITSEKYRELESYQLKINDIVVARRGEIGRCALVNVSTPLFCGTGSMFIRITSNYYPMLLQYQIYNTSLKEYLLSKAKGVTMKNLNSTTLGNLQVLNPPITLQSQFAAIASKVESLKSRYQSSLSNQENLYGALSQKAFKGELDLSRVPMEEETRMS